MWFAQLSFRSFIFSLWICVFFCVVSATTLHAQDGSDPATASASGPSEQVLKGENLFKANCASCHKVKGNLVGPALYGSPQRWEAAGDYKGKTGKEWLYEWVRNSQGVIKEGYPYAVSLFEQWNKSVMQAFPQLTNDDIDAVLAYVEYNATAAPAAAAAASATGGGSTGGGSSPYTQFLLITLISLLLIIALILMRVTNVLNRLVMEKEGEVIPVPVPLYKNKKIIATLSLLLVIYIGYTTVNNAIDLGRQQGYAPTQPIKFSHKLHAGLNQVNCQYCHSSAAKSKHSNIPSANVCMNCHKGIQQGPEYGRKEIAKIYAAIGYDPAKLSYIENYAQMPVEDAKALFTAWLESDEEKKYSQADVNEVLAQVQQPIEWVRIHNLPDHAYFNHAQHVNVGGLACQTCHGPVEEMEVLYQYSPLSMGWCISCHRETEVNFASNGYYEIYEKFHRDLKGEKFTVEKIGGTECQKCHY